MGRASSTRTRTRPPDTSTPEAAPLPAYAEQAGAYDGRTSLFASCRARIVDALGVQPGDVVLDVGCGTGLCFEWLRDRVGDTGQVLGIDGSPEMAGLARERVARHGWDNVTVLESSVAEAEIPVVADRAVFCAVHDVLQDVAGLRNVLGSLRPGGTVAAGGGKFAGSPYVALDAYVAALHRPFVRSLDGFGRPWTPLDTMVENLTVSEFAMGTGYCAVGAVAG